MGQGAPLVGGSRVGALPRLGCLDPANSEDGSLRIPAWSGITPTANHHWEVLEDAKAFGFNVESDWQGSHQPGTGRVAGGRTVDPATAAAGLGPGAHRAWLADQLH